MAEARGERRGLGRGLAALLGEAPPEPRGGADLRQVPVDAIAPNPDQPRRAIDQAALEALAASVRATGLLQPVVVRPLDGGGFQLVAGERRWRAARLAGLEAVPALVRQADERERLELALVENVVREDLNPIEVAQACACLIEDFGQSHAALAERLGRSRPALSNLVRLLELPEGVQRMIAEGRLTEGHGRAILMADGPARRARVAERAAADGLSVRATEALARAQAAPEERGRRRAAPPPPLADAATWAFGTAFDAPVRVRAGSGAQVVVELRFPDEQSLQAALARLEPPPA